MRLSRAQTEANHARVYADADTITQRLLTTNDTIGQLRKEYGVGDWLIHKVYAERTTPKQREKARLRKLDAHGNPGRFKRGIRPWNTGKKGWCPKGSEKGHFQKGCMRGNAARRYVPVGTVHVRNDHGRKMKMVKIRDDGPSPRRWVPLSRYLWEKKYGPLPSDCIVTFKDGDPENVVLDNLDVISRGELLNKNNADPDRRQRHSKTIWKNRRMKGDVNAFRRERLGPVVEVILCAGCGEDAEAGTKQCVKCQGTRFEKIKRAA